MQITKPTTLVDVSLAYCYEYLFNYAEWSRVIVSYPELLQRCTEEVEEWVFWFEFLGVQFEPPTRRVESLNPCTEIPLTESDLCNLGSE
jgi:hypothetical protein